MQIVAVSDLLPILAKALGKPVMFISLRGMFSTMESSGDWSGALDENGVFLAAPYLDFQEENVGQLSADEIGFVICETEEEMMALYHQTVGDDGPTKTNPYNGPFRVYALTCNAQGELETENT